VVFAAIIVVMMLEGCTYLPTNHIAVRRDLRVGFPGFEISNLDSTESWPFSFDAVEISAFEFELQSKEVDGFVLEGTYYVGGAFSRAAQERAIGGSIFNGESLDEAELASLERTWVAMKPGSAVSVGAYANTGRAEPILRQRGFVPQHRDADVADVYLLESLNDFFFFELDRESGEWKYIPDFVGDDQL
jgi:hypothetical protein